MGIEAKHSYRFGYLKSEHWQNLRLAKLAEEDARCLFCGKRDPSNDVHHIYYPKDLYSVTTKWLCVLCRPHHERMHEVIDELKKSHRCDRQGDHFKLFRLASAIIEKEAIGEGHKPLSKSGCRLKASKIVSPETDKCPHTLRINTQMRQKRADREIIEASSAAGRVIKKTLDRIEKFGPESSFGASSIARISDLAKTLHGEILDFQSKIVDSPNLR